METPKIGERVKFWQEQDRINRELIPRVIKNHELLTKHVETHDEGHLSAMTQIQAVEAQVGELSNTTKAQIEGVEGQVGKLSINTKAQIEDVQGQMTELATATKAQIKGVEALVGELAATTKVQIESVEALVGELAATKAQIEGVEGRVSEIEQRSTDLLSRLAPHTGIVIALAALIVALVK